MHGLVEESTLADLAVFWKIGILLLWLSGALFGQEVRQNRQDQATATQKKVAIPHNSSPSKFYDTPAPLPRRETRRPDSLGPIEQYSLSLQAWRP